MTTAVADLSLDEFNEVSGLGLQHWQDEWFAGVLTEFQRVCANLVTDVQCRRDSESRAQCIHVAIVSGVGLPSIDPVVDVDLFAHCMGAHEVEIADFPQVIVDRRFVHDPDEPSVSREQWVYGNPIADLPITGIGYAQRALYLAYFHAVERVLDWSAGQDKGSATS